MGAALGPSRDLGGDVADHAVEPAGVDNGAGVAVGIVWMFVDSFPRATPAPAVSVRRGSGTVQSISHIDRLFGGHRSRGLDAAQPVDVVAVEFLPEGWAAPVVAVDLVDCGSLGLREKAAVTVEYEANAPRRAHLAGRRGPFHRRTRWGR